MYILYIDDAGSVGNPNEKHFVLGAVALYEAHGFYLEQALNQVALETGLPKPESLEFHGNEMLAGRSRWRQLRNRDQRRSAIASGLRAGYKLAGDWRLFGVVIEKAARPGEDLVEYAFEQLCSRFDLFLTRKSHASGQKNKGLIVFDNSAKATRLQQLALGFRSDGTRWGRMRNLADVPFFVDSKATRTVQYADLVSYALYRAFEHDDWEFYDVVRSRFDREGGVVHGLLHERFANSRCPCDYCDSRRAS